MKRFLKHFLKANRVQLLILPVVLILALLSGAIYFNFDRIVSSKTYVSVKGRKYLKKKEGKKRETPASSLEPQVHQREKEEKKSTTSTKNREALPPSQFSQSPNEERAIPPNQQENQQKTQKETFQVELSIDHGVKKTYFVEVAKGSTVYDLLKEASSQYGFSLDVSYDPAYGAFIEEIDGVRNNPQEGKYWLYYLNDKLANLGASSQKLSLGNKVLWKYEKPQ